MTEQDILLWLCLGVFPLLYLALCFWMKRAVSNPPWLAFFFIFGSVAGYLLLCAYLMPSPVGLFVILPYMLVADLVLMGVFDHHAHELARGVDFMLQLQSAQDCLSLRHLLLVMLASVFRISL